MRPKGVQKIDRIVQTADTLFYQKGYDHTSFSDIAEAAGLNRGNFYHYFKSKNAILDAVIETRLEAIHSQLKDWEENNKTPLDRLKRFVHIIRDNEKEAICRGCPIGTLTTELGKDHADEKPKARKMFDVYVSWLEQQFHALGYTREAKVLSLRLLAYMQGISVVAHAYEEKSFLRREADQLGVWLDELAENRKNSSQ